MRILKPGEYQWKETPGGTGWVLLRHDPQRGTQTRMLRYGPAITLPATDLDHTVEWIVLRGEAHCGPRTLRRRGFYCWPAGTHRDAVSPGKEGYTVLSFVYGPESPQRRPPVAIESMDTLPWQQEELFPGAGLCQIRRLNQDRDSDAAISLVRGEAGREGSTLRTAGLVELFVLEGTAGLERERLLPASYVAIEPGELWGPLRAETGMAILLINQHGGPRR